MEPHQASLPSRISAFVSHPYTVFVALIATLLALPVSIYLYVKSDHKPLLTYEVQSVNTSVVRAGQSSKLTVSYDGQPLVEDVTAAQVAFWNAGDLAIHGVLKPLRIYTNPKALILEARIRHATRDVLGLKIDQSEMAKGIVIVRWDLLERNDGGVVQLIFTGKTDSIVEADVVIEGQPAIRRVGSESSDNNWGKRSLALLTVALFTMGMNTFVHAFTKGKIGQLALRVSPRWAGLIATLGAVLLASLLVLILVQLVRTPAPPFEF